MESWLEPTSGCDSPEMTVKSSRKSLSDFQVGRELVVLAGFLREEIRRMQAQRRVDAHHAAGRRPARPRRAPRSQSVEQRQRQRHAGGAEECAAGEVSWQVLEFGRSGLRDTGDSTSACSRSLVLKQLALDDLVDQRPEAVILVADLARRSPRSPACRPPRALRRWRRSAASSVRARASWSLSFRSSCLNSSMFRNAPAIRQHVGGVDLRALAGTASGGRPRSPASPLPVVR